ncbi:MAG: flagellar hook-length control protein FliK [Pseudomonadota bacterium]
MTAASALALIPTPVVSFLAATPPATGLLSASGAPQDTRGVDQPFAALLADIGFTAPVQPAVTSTVSESGTVLSGAFGRPFNYDPTFLVTADTDVTLADNAALPATFAPDLLAALTPGTPVEAQQAVSASQPLADDVLQSIAATVKAPIQTSAQNSAPTETDAILLQVDNGDAASPVLLSATGLTIPAMATFTADEAAKSAVPAIATSATDSTRADIITVAIQPVVQPKDKAQPASTAAASPGVVLAEGTVIDAAAAPAQALPDKSAVGTAILKWFEGGNGDILLQSADNAPLARPAAPAALLSPSTTLAAQTQTEGDHVASSQGQMDNGDFSATLSGPTAVAGADGDILLMTPHGVISPTVVGSTVTHTPAASALHPATGMVAANLQAAAGNADKVKHFSLTLNPAELGRVLVDMKLDADKKMKITLTVEKESTFQLLQRDASALQSLFDKSANAADITFELAGDQQSFDGASDQRSAFQEAPAKQGEATALRLHAPDQNTSNPGENEISVAAGRVNKLI